MNCTGVSCGIKWRPEVLIVNNRKDTEQEKLEGVGNLNVELM